MGLIKRILKVGAKLETFKNGLSRLFIVAGGFWVVHVLYALLDRGEVEVYFFEEEIYNFGEFLFYVTLGLLSLWITYVSIIWIVKGPNFNLRSINFKGGLTRIWIVLSVVYVILALFVLAKNSDCVGYTARLAKAQSIESVNNSKISRLMDKLPKEKRKVTKKNRTLEDEQISNLQRRLRERLAKERALSSSFNEKLDQMREVYPRYASEILDLETEINKYKARVGGCASVFIWRFDNKRYANIGTMLGTTLGGLILLWGSLYILFGIGRGLCWIKDGFTGGSSNESNELETRIDDEEGK